MINSNDDAPDRNLSEETAAHWRGPFAETGPRVFTIDPGEPFLTRLASGLAASAPDPRNPLLITDVQLFLPTRRAARGLSEALLSVAADQDEPAAGAAFTPRIRALGDIEDTDLLELAALAGGAPPEAFPPPAMGEAARRFSAVGAVLAASEGEPPSDLAALALADEFNALQDSLYTEEVDINRLDTAAPAEHAAHWGEALKLAKAARKAVSDRAHRDGVMDPAARQAAMVDLLARIWARTPPTHPVVAAGSTGSAPAVARLLAAIARLPQGCVVLPGLDLDLNARGWARIDDPHPQNGLKKLLAAMDVDRSDVRPWPGPASAAPSPGKPSAARRRLWSAALRPAEATDDWRAIAADLAATDPGAAGAAQGLHRIIARDDGEEAGAIALLMRETLEQRGRTAMLVTPDRVLARRVCARLARWGVEADDSAGAPLSSTPLGAFLRLAAAAAIAPAPLSLLSLLTSKICDETGVCGLSPEETREGLRVLDLYAFRGPAGPPGVAGLRKKLTDWSAGDALKTEAARRGARLLGALESAFAPLADVTVQGRAPLRAWLSAHAAVAESLVGQGADLWEGADGEAAADAMAGALSAADAGAETDNEDHSAVFHVSPLSYPAAFDQLIGAAVVRAGPPAHARLSILGPLEARLQSADRIILGALNEGVWPADVGADPWLSRPMRAAVGLPPPERRIGLAAHDFMQLASAPEVFLSRAARRGGAPAAPSRWMLRLETLLANEAQPGGLEVKRAPASALRATDATPRLRSWLAALDAPDGFAPAEPPHPRPPAAARPRSMSATAIETWVRDPYAIYAKRILRLRRLDAHEAPIGPAERGSALHEILAAWSRIDPGDPSAEQRMQDAAEQVLHGGAPPAIAALWAPRVVAMAQWYRRWAVERAPAWRPAIIEETGTLTLPRPGGDFTLTARADRIDAGAAGVSIIDFKTGDPPNLKQVSAGFSPQLPLEAAIAGAGGFEPLTERRIAELLYIKVGGRDGGRPAPIGAGDLGGPGGPVGEDAADLTDKALEGLKALIDQYDDADTPYRSQPRAQYVDDYGDYDHLARRKEWAGGGDAS